VVKVIWYKATSPSHTDGSVVLARLCQCAPHVTHASFGLPKSITQTASLSVQSILHSSQQSVVGHARTCPFHLNCPFAWGAGHPLTRFYGFSWVHNPNGISISSAVFAQLTSDCHHASCGMPFPSKLPLPKRDLDTYPICGSLVHLTQHPKKHRDRFSRFSSSWQTVPILYHGRPFPPKLPIPVRHRLTHL